MFPNILNPACVLMPLDAPDESAAITLLVDSLDEAGRLSDRDAVLEAVLARERVRHTGIGMGLAVPHAKCDGCQSLSMAIGKLISPVDCGGADGIPCGLIVLLVSPTDNTAGHIRALAHVARLWISDDFRTDVDGASDPAGLYAAVESRWDTYPLRNGLGDRRRD